jgi:hypothetical protein
MDSLLLTGTGLAALGYVFFVVWRSVRGESASNCGGSGSCSAGGCCNHKPVVRK